MASHDKDSLQMGHKRGRSRYRRKDPINIFPLFDDIALFNQEGLLDPGDFVKECQKHGIQVVNEAELEWYERKGLLYPILRIPMVKQWYYLKPDGLWETDDATPADNKVYQYRAYPVTGYGRGGNVQALRDEGLLIQPNRQPFHPWREFHDPQAYFGNKRTIATYYHLYQILHVYWLKQKIIVQKRWRRESEDEWVEDIRILANQLPRLWDFRQELYDYDILVALFLAIQNRYRPSAIGILSNYANIEQYTSYVEHFSAHAVLNNVPMSLEALRRWRSVLRRQGCEIDPLSKWSDLVGYVGGRKRRELRGLALLAQEFYVMAEMVSSFLEDLARERGEEKPDPERERKQYYQHQRFGRGLNYRDIDILEQILTDYNLNPRPRVLFVVEGKTEKTVIPILCEAMGLRLETFGVTLYDIAGVDKKDDLSVFARFVAPPRLGTPVQPELYAAARQTRVFMLFDREGTWQDYPQSGKKGEEKARKVVYDLRNKIKEMLPEDLPNQAKDMTAKRGVMIKLWERSFEFDNFSDEELAEAISAEAHKYGWPEITPHDVASFRARFPNVSLDDIIAQKVRDRTPASGLVAKGNYKWDKVEVGKQLARVLAQRLGYHTLGDPPEAPIIRVIQHVIYLAQENWP
jgi:hypothetical protein